MKLSRYKNRDKVKPYLILTIGLFLITVSAYFLYESYALYEEAKDFNVINGTVEDPGDIYFAYYIDGEISREMPSQNTGYTLDVEKSSCNNGVIPDWDNAGWKFIGDYHNYNAPTNTRTKCNLYFNKTSKTVSTVLGNIEVNSYTPDFTKSACDDETCESHEKGIYETTDYDGNPTYYYRGSVENNYVKFAGYYWRIIRINSNGSIRIVYDGTSSHENGEVSEDRQIGKSQFSSSWDDNMYVGYMYNNNDIHGILISSTLKMTLDSFYESKVSNLIEKLDLTEGFCNNRQILNVDMSSGLLKNITYYENYLDVIESTASLKCDNKLDYFTISESLDGNKALVYPIGTITVPEVIFAGYAGGYFNGMKNYNKTNLNGYLTIGNDYWTMSPVGFYNPFGYYGNFPVVFLINSKGRFDDSGVENNLGVRPVINIRSDVTITGIGTMTDPYVVN